MSPAQAFEPILLRRYDPAFRDQFEALNRVWLEAHGLLEAADLEYLRNPAGTYLAHGGEVFFAVQGDRLAGSCAALRISPEVFELAKLAVAPWAKGRGLGRTLSEAVLQFARDAGARQVVLASNSALVTAIRLYEAMGFRHVPKPAEVRYRTADVYMALEL